MTERFFCFNKFSSAVIISFGEKNMKWNILICMAVLGMPVACGIVELESGQKEENGVWVSPSHGNGNQDSDKQESGVSPAKKSLYVTALEYPKDYDWRSDLEKGSVRCSLVVYRDGSPVMKLAVGDEYQVSSDADMHRMVGSDLYTDYSTDIETIIKKNGQECFRYSGRESIYGIHVVGKDIYTLGQSRSGEGFSFRKNGEAILVRGSGSLYSHFDYDRDDGFSFSFNESVSSQSGKVQRHYMVRDSLVSQVAMREDIRYVWDVILHDGQPCYVASVRGINGLLLADGDKLSALDIPGSAMVFTARILLIEGDVVVEAVIGEDVGFTSIIWRNGELVKSFSDCLTVVAFDSSSESMSCALNSPFRRGGGLIFNDSEEYEIPEGYVCSTNKAVARKDGILHVGLSSVNGGQPCIWKESRMEQLPVNGFITEIKASAP